jgi:hypothetical protein
MYKEELKQIFAEVQDLSNETADLQMLEALANNTVYILSKLQLTDNKNDKTLASLVLADMLNTLNKEFVWAKEEEDSPIEKQKWFQKAKKQVLEDMQVLFENE